MDSAAGVNEWAAAVAGLLNVKYTPQLDEKVWLTTAQIADKVGISQQHGRRIIKKLVAHGKADSGKDMRLINGNWFLVPVYRLKKPR